MTYSLKIRKIKNKLMISEEFEIDFNPVELIKREEKKKNILIYQVDEKNTSDLDVIKLSSFFNNKKWKVRLEGKKTLAKGFEELLIEAGFNVEINQ